MCFHIFIGIGELKPYEEKCSSAIGNPLKYNKIHMEGIGLRNKVFKYRE